MAMDWQELKKEIEKYCKNKYAENGIAPIFSKNNIIYHLKLNEEDVKCLRKTLVALLKEGKIMKYGGHTYRWNITPHE